MTIDQPTSETEARRLRNSLVGQLRDQGHITNGRVEEAVRTVPRHVFVPDVPLADAYLNDAVVTKHGTAGAISVASQPSIVTLMLEQLQVDEGHNVLEIGAGTGYNAALLAQLTGPGGHVTTMDVDDDLVVGARARLARAGSENVEVICGDGALGHPGHAPYDRLIATVATADLPTHWLRQTSPAGRLVVPVRIRGSVPLSIAWERNGARWSSMDSRLCAFVPLRDSVATDPRRMLALTEDHAVTLWIHPEQDIDPRALDGIFRTPAHATWTGIELGKGAPVDALWLWLACVLPNSLSRMPVHTHAVDAGVVTPMLDWGSVATVDTDSLAYLTMRPAPGDRHEVGVIGHGPARRALVETMAEQIVAWDDRRSTPIGFDFLPKGATSGHVEPAPGRFVMHRPSGVLAVTW